MKENLFMIEYSKLQIGCMLIVIYIAFIYFRERYAYKVNGNFGVYLLHYGSCLYAW